MQLDTILSRFLQSAVFIVVFQVGNYHETPHYNSIIILFLPRPKYLSRTTPLQHPTF